VKRTEYDVLHVTVDGFLGLLGAEGEKDDVRVPAGEVGERIKAMVEEEKSVVVVILAALGQEMAIDAKAVAED